MSLLSWRWHGTGSSSLGAGQAIGTATGTGSASAVGRSTAASIGQAMGTGTAVGATVGTTTGSAIAGIRHRFVSAITDSANPDKIQASDWNRSHIWATVASDPPAPVPGQLWTLASGLTPDRTLELKFCDLDGVVVTLLTIYR